MADTVAITADTSLSIGGSDWRAGMEEDTRGFTVTGSITTPDAGADGRPFIEKNIADSDLRLSVSAFYYGQNAKALDGRQCGDFVFVSSRKAEDCDETPTQHKAICGGVSWLGLTEAAPISDVLTNDLELLMRDPWLFASTGMAVPFALTASSGSVSLPAFTNDDLCFIDLASGTADMTISDGTNNIALEVAGPSIHRVDLGSLSNSVSGGTLAATVAGDGMQAGWIVFGKPYEVAQGRAV